MAFLRALAGVSTNQCAESIDFALTAYAELSDEALAFDPQAAKLAAVTKDKPYAAVSKTAFMYLGEQAGILSIVAVGPQGHNGHPNTMESTRYLGDNARPSAILPKSRQGVRTELYLPIAAFNLADPAAQPARLTGSLAVFRNVDGEIRETGNVGSDARDFKAALKAGSTNDDPDMALLVKSEATEITCPGTEETVTLPQCCRYGTEYALQNPYDNVLQLFARATITMATIGEETHALDSLTALALRQSGQVS